MPENTEGQVPAGGQEPQQTTTPSATPAQPAGTAAPLGPDGKPLDLERAARLIDDLRNDLKAVKAKAKDGESAQARLKEIEDAQKTETERLSERVRELETALSGAQAAHREALTVAAIEREASAAGFHDAEDAARLIDAGAITYGDDGRPANVAALVKKLAEVKPHLVKAQGNGAAGAAATTGARAVPSTPKPSGNPTRADLERRAEERLASSGRYGRL